MDDLVVGDIVHLSAGDMIPADVRILDAKDLFISQASLTGESEPVEKTPKVCAQKESITDYSNIAFMGSNVISGSACIRLRWREAKRMHWRQLVLLTEIALLFVVGFFPAAWDIGANALVSFSCAMQVQAFRKVHGYPFASTMCIGNLRSGMDSLVGFGHTRDKKLLWKSLHYFGVIFVFALGAGIGTQCVGIFGEKTIWLSCALLLVSLCFMFIKEDLPEIEEELEK